MRVWECRSRYGFILSVLLGFRDSLLLPDILHPSMALELEREIFDDKSANYRGAARISLANLDLEFPDRKRTLDDTNVDRLVRNFELEGCLRLEPEHYVPALIDDEILSAALRESGLEQAALLSFSEPPELLLPDGLKLRALEGQHRLLAGSRFLLPGERDWVVQLYSAGSWSAMPLWMGD